jgi:hypothetical protein
LQAELILIHKTLSRAAPQNTEPVSPPAGILAARREHLTHDPDVDSGRPRK